MEIVLLADPHCVNAGVLCHATSHATFQNEQFLDYELRSDYNRYLGLIATCTRSKRAYTHNDRLGRRRGALRRRSVRFLRSPRKVHPKLCPPKMDGHSPFLQLPAELRRHIVSKPTGRRVTSDLRLRVYPSRRISKRYANPTTHRL